jgi:AmmeMemoRadiSam system protein A
MSTDRGQTLLAIARASISTALGQPLQAAEDAHWLQEWGASFVTLTQHGQLRGCIGTLQARRCLLADVKSNAVSAALHDPRFLPLKASELAQTEIEVSVLSPMQALQFENEQHALAQLQPGVDGIALEYAHHRGTFLPQVWEQLPDGRDFLTQLKRKAGLPPGFWSEELKLYRYSVAKYKESQSRDVTNTPRRSA